MDNELGKMNLSQGRNVTDIFKKYQSPLRGYIVRQVSSKEDSEDILQNVFYQLSKLDLEANPISQISGWLYAVARNQIIDRSRKKKENEMPYLFDTDSESVFIKEVEGVLLDAESSPETDLLKAMVWEELDIALAELPDEQRSVFELTELEGISFKEISESTGIATNTLISRKRYAVLHLRKRLFNLYEDLLIG